MLLHHLCQAPSSARLVLIRIILWLFPEQIHARTTPGKFLALHCAAARGDVGLTRRLLACGSNVDAVESGGMSALLMAAANGHTQVVQALLEKGAGQTLSDGKLRCPAYHAAQAGHADALRLLLADRGAEKAMSLSDRSGYTCLHAACLTGQRECAELLMAAGAEVDRMAKDGTTPIMACSRSANSAIAERLLQQGAEATHHDSFGSTIVHAACGSGGTNPNKGLIEALARHKQLSCSVNSMDNDGLAPLHVLCQAATRIPPRAPFEGPASIIGEIVDHLIAAGASIDQADYGGTTALMVVAWGEAGGDAGERGVALTKRLLDARADAAIECDQGWSALHVALHQRNHALEGLLGEHLQNYNADHLDSFDALKPRDLSNSRYVSKRGAHNRIPIEQRLSVLQGGHACADLARWVQAFRAEHSREPQLVVMTGAGISTSCGIPDYCSPGTAVGLGDVSLFVVVHRWFNN